MLTGTEPAPEARIDPIAPEAHIDPIAPEARIDPVAPDDARIGRVVSIEGAKVVVLLHAAATEASGVQMGALVKVMGRRSRVFGLIEGMSIPIPREQGGERELRVAEIGLLGEVAEGAVAGGFRRGVSRLPSLDDAVALADADDTRLVYAMPDRQVVQLGHVHQNGGVPARVSVDDMLGKHFALLGTTGTGKSCALTLLLKGMLAQNPHAHVLLLDPHGEYGRAFGDRAEHLSGESLRLPYWILTFEEITEVVFGAERDGAAAEVMHLRELIIAAKQGFARDARAAPSAGPITVDTPVPYALGELNRLLDEAMGRLDNRAALGPYLHLKARLLSLQADRRYDFMFATGLALRDNLAALLGRIFRVPAEGKPIAILDLAGIPSEVLNVVVAVVCRLAFDVALWAGQLLPLLLVCEEAHRYAPQDAGLGFEPAKRGLARIAKEGRKYGISLGVLSQRPSDLASSILSQCSTVLAFRMTSEKDQEIIGATLSEAGAALVHSLPLLGNGEALAVGEGVSVPMRLRFSALPPEERPRSASASFSGRWQDPEMPADLLARIVDGWRGRRTEAEPGLPTAVRG